MAAFSKILENGVPGVELDVHLCRSGELVVIHDSVLDRVTGLDAKVSETDYSELSRLDAGSWFGEAFKSERIPLLDDVIDLMGDKVYYDIEIKNQTRVFGSLEQALVEQIRRRGIAPRVLVSSFNPLAIRYVRHAAPELETAVIYSDHPEVPWILRNGFGRFICRPQVLKPNREKINSWSMFMRQTIEGYPIVPWTEDDPARVEEYLDLGVDGIITNLPELMMPRFQALWSRRKAD
jgi:glycerophosphoryl diester phosphodiesterase